MVKQCFRAHRRAQTNRFMSKALQHLGQRPKAKATFHALCDQIWRQSTLLNLQYSGRQHPGVAACLNMALHHKRMIRPPRTWGGVEGSIHIQVAALFSHLFGRYPSPMAFTCIWMDEHNPHRGLLQRMTIDHAQGGRFRSPALPLPFSRQMEHNLLTSEDHWPLPEAIRRAELGALGASPEVARAVLGTHLAWDLRHGRFWRDVLAFFVRYRSDIDPHMIAPIIDFLHAIRHRATECLGPNGVEIVPPSSPNFSMKGRTPKSINRLMETWHKSLHKSGRNATWPGAPYLPFRMVEERGPDLPPSLWTISELRTAMELREEGQRLQHCVGSYAWYCQRGRSSIWSLRRSRENEGESSLVTIEVLKARRTIIQARSFKNRRPKAHHWRIIHVWAKKNGLALGSLLDRQWN